MIDDKKLDNIVENTLKTMEESKSQIYEIYEGARNEVVQMHNELAKLQAEVQKTLIATEGLANMEKMARRKLSEVSSDFSLHTEADIKRSYEHTQKVQVELAIMREKEHQLLNQRNHMEIRLRQMEKTAEKAKALVSKVGVMLDYLSVHMGDVAAQLETANQEKYSAQMIIKAQEDERLRVSQEIHDGPAQLIANILYRSSVCEAKMDMNIAEAKHDIKIVKSQIRDCLSEIRQIIFDLRPMTLDDLGLVAAIYHFIRRYEERTGMKIEFGVQGEEIRLIKYHEVGLFRIIQESLNNVHKHSGVNEAEVLLHYDKEKVMITIKDEGKGFDAEAKRKEIRRGENASYGLLGIWERVKILNGQINIKSKFGKGTTIKVSVPLVERE